MKRPVPTLEESLYIKIDDLKDDLKDLQDDAAILLHERCSDAYGTVRHGDDLAAARACVEWEAYAEGFRTALELVEKHLGWIEEKDNIDTEEPSSLNTRSP